MQHIDAVAREEPGIEAVDPERGLLDRIATQDRAALAQLYDRFRRPLFRYLCQLTPDTRLAEEILQDTVLAVWQGAGRFQGRSSVRTWLFGIARRQAHNTLRRRGPLLASGDQLDYLSDTAPGPEGRAIAAADAATLAAALRRLSPIHREVLVLVLIEGMSYAEVATALEIPDGTVKSRLSNAKRALRAFLRAGAEAEQ